MMDLAAALSPTAEERARRCREYLEALEEERRKIQVFQRELPLSLHLVTQAIENYRQQMAAELMLADGCAVRSELEEEAEEMSGEGAPVLEEFIPIKRSCSSEDEEEAGDRRQDDHQHSSNGGHNDEDSCSSRRRQKQQETSSEKRPDWLMSVQLWSQHRDSSPLLSEEEHAAVEINPLRPSVAVEGKKATGAFHPFHPQKRSLPPPAASALVEAAPVPAPAPAVPATSSTSDTRGGGGRGGSGGGGGKSGCSGGDEKDGHHRKARRCWSPELHRRFLSALQQLGGSDVATPKRIRELMMVDGLTNDEVKSHLQKYRLHSRRPSPTSHANSGSPPPQHVVFVGGIWVPPPEYAAAASAAATAAAAARPPSEGIPPGPPSGIYAPIASVPAPKQQQQPQQQQQQKKQVKQQQQQPRWSPGGRDEQCVADAAATRSHSAAPSSSSRTTTSGSPGRGR